MQMQIPCYVTTLEERILSAFEGALSSAISLARQFRVRSLVKWDYNLKTLDIWKLP
jgi:hypothetical protein